MNGQLAPLVVAQKRIFTLGRGYLNLSVFLISLSAGHGALGQAFVANNSTTTTCAEEDNVNIPVFGDVNEFTIAAVHPSYPVTTYLCPTDFQDCNQTSATDFKFSPATLNMYDDGVRVLVANRLGSFWRPHGMTVKVKSKANTFTDAHYIAVSKRVTGESSWPQFLVLYSDGNMRLIPHPPLGHTSVCFGASVVVGPAEPSNRPWCGIAQVEFDPSGKTLLLTYESGGTASLALSVDRTAAMIRVQVAYPTGLLPFATLRSMFVREDDCDTARVTVHRQGKLAGAYGVLDPFVCLGDEFTFYRNVPSVHTMSGPDIVIHITSPSPSAN